jgi:hypothetical protein
MRFSACECRAEHYTRVRRSAWMKLLGGRRLYRCLACNHALFIRETDALGSPFKDTVVEQPPARTRRGKGTGSWQSTIRS